MPLYLKDKELIECNKLVCKCDEPKFISRLVGTENDKLLPTQVCEKCNRFKSKFVNLEETLKQ